MRSVLEFPRKTALPFPLRFLILCAVLLASTLARPARAGDNLLAGREPSHTHGVSNSRVLTDGQCANEGTEWNLTAAAIFDSEGAFVEYDLGKSTPIVAAYLQGDNNDDYVISISDNRTKFLPLWHSGQKNEIGLRERWTDGLQGQGRYVRLMVHGGDRAYSATELQLFAERPAHLPPELRRVSGENGAARVRTCLLYFAVAVALLLFSTRASSSWPVLALGAGLVLVAAAVALDAISRAWPIAGREVSFVRAVAGTIALLAMWRCAVPAKRFVAHRWVVTACLAASALIAIASFYNLGRSQFWNHAENRPEFVHTYDMRVYQPFAKYFQELQYDGVYLASVLAYAEDEHAGSFDQIARTEVRSLRDHRVRRVGDITEQIRQVRARFSDQRWAALKKDMRYFEQTMGPEFLSSLTDHGANATPVWVFFARLVLAHSDASEQSLTLGALADGVLLALMAIAIWRSFGLWPTLVSVVIFGANDLYMFDTNWTGATLRHDWLALLGFAVCALKKERWLVAGMCLGLSAMIRAFPAAALLGVSLPMLWWTYDYVRREKRLPGWKSLRAEQSEALSVLCAAAITIALAVTVTGLLYSFSSWMHWWDKVTLLNREGSLNEVSLRALVVGSYADTGHTLIERRPLHLAAIALCIGCVFWLARRRPLHEAMLLGLPLSPMLWNPSNYYSHLIFLLALLGSVAPSEAPQQSADVRPDPVRPRFSALNIPLHRIAAPLLALCVAGYWSALDPDIGRHFQDETMILFTAFGWLYAALLRRDPTVEATLFR